MAAERKMLHNLYKMFGNFRSALLARSSFPECRQIAGFKQTLEEKLGIPVKPKKPLSPFFRFMGQVRPMVAQQHPDARVTDHTKIIAQQWQKLELSAKQKLEEEYKKEMIHYLAVRVAYDNSLTDQQKEDLQKAKEEKAESKQQKQLKIKKKELGKPKKPLSAFLIFFQEKIKLKGDAPFKIWQQKLSQEWESLPDEKKVQYLDKASHHLQIYRQELQLWEEKMIRLGHIDVVRNEALIEPRGNK